MSEITETIVRGLIAAPLWIMAAVFFAAGIYSLWMLSRQDTEASSWSKYSLGFTVLTPCAALFAYLGALAMGIFP